MEITIFDVEHGACSLVKFPSGETMLIDCGHNADTGWRPSLWLKQEGIYNLTNLTISNMDEDHVSDLPNVYKSCPPVSLTRNWYLNSPWVRAVKAEGGIGNGIQAACTMMDNYTGPSLITNWGETLVERFCHSPNNFPDENSLSVVTFISYNGIRIVFPGDLTAGAWQAFLKSESFCEKLKQVNIFVASHHGREDGYEPSVFKLCKPDIIIISDKEIMHDTQEVDYNQHASGITWNTTDKRKVLTTRNDGTIKIQDTVYGGYYINSCVNVQIINSTLNR